MSLRRIMGAVARLDNVMVHAPRSAPWPMCRTCWDEIEELSIMDDPEPTPGRNPLVIRVRARCHGAEETVHFDMLSTETLAQDPEALAKVCARFPFFNEKFGHVGK